MLLLYYFIFLFPWWSLIPNMQLCEHAGPARSFWALYPEHSAPHEPGRAKAVLAEWLESLSAEDDKIGGLKELYQHHLSFGV